MTERERLVELIETAVSIMQNTPEKLANYLLERGVIVPPCKVGDIIYALTFDRKDCTPLTVPSRDTLMRWMDDDLFGSELFLTREEAEAALAERRHTR